MLLSFLSYAKSSSAANPAHHRLSLVMLSVVFATIATFCKEQGITVAAINAAYDFSVFCTLDIATFCKILFNWSRARWAPVKTSETPEDSTVAASKSNGTKQAQTPPTADTKVHSAPLPPHVVAFLVRLATVAVPLFIVMAARLSLNRGREYSPDERTNRWFCNCVLLSCSS